MGCGSDHVLIRSNVEARLRVAQIADRGSATELHQISPLTSHNRHTSIHKTSAVLLLRSSRRSVYLEIRPCAARHDGVERQRPRHQFRRPRPASNAITAPSTINDDIRSSRAHRRAHPRAVFKIDFDYRVKQAARPRIRCAPVKVPDIRER